MLGGEPADLAVGLCGVVAQFEHRAEDGDRAAAGVAGHRGQGLDRGAHRVGVGVVGVVDDPHPVGAVGDLHPPGRHLLGVPEQPRDLLDGGAVRQSRTGGGECVQHVVLPGEAQAHGRAAGGGMESERGAAVGVEADGGGADLRGLAQPEREDLGAGASGHRGHPGVVRVEDGPAVLG